MASGFSGATGIGAGGSIGLDIGILVADVVDALI
jgi:hypothetical protein